MPNWSLIVTATLVVVPSAARIESSGDVVICAAGVAWVTVILAPGLTAALTTLTWDTTRLAPLTMPAPPMV